MTLIEDTLPKTPCGYWKFDIVSSSIDTVMISVLFAHSSVGSASGSGTYLQPDLSTQSFILHMET